MRGRLRDDGLAAFLAAGFTTAQLLEIIAGIAQKTIRNYTNHIAETPLDRPFEKFAWTPADAAQETARVQHRSGSPAAAVDGMEA